MPSAPFLATVVSLGLLFHPSPARSADSADGSIVAHAQVRGQDVPVYRIAELQAADTPQGMDGFAIRVAYALQAWSRRNGVEASGNLCRTPDGARWGTVLVTVHAHAASPRTNACPAGMQATGVDIHSHPQRQRYAVNDTDRLFLGEGLRYQDQVATRPDTFSPADYAHPGYLVGRLWLHYQERQDQDRRVWSMGKPQPAWEPLLPRARLVRSACRITPAAPAANGQRSGCRDTGQPL